ncbi:MAG: hypothetical protein GY756_00910 [bacterium]|nr:hypothetical protein [bacterium]
MYVFVINDEGDSLIFARKRPENKLLRRHSYNERLCLILLSSLCIICYLLLTILLFRNIKISDIFIYNPQPAISFVSSSSRPFFYLISSIFLCQLLILIVLAKGLIYGYFQKIANRNTVMLIRIIILIVFIIFYVPKLVFPFSVIDWLIIHVFGIILMFSVIHYVRDYDCETKTFKSVINPPKKILPKISLKSIEIIILYALIYIILFCFLLFSILNSFIGANYKGQLANVIPIHTMLSMSIFNSFYDILKISLLILLYFPIYWEI